MNIRRAIFALGAACVLSFWLMLTPTQAEAATVTINPRANAVEAGQILAAPDGSAFTITVYDAGLADGQKSVTHTYQTGDTLRQTANKIVQAINADTDLQSIGVTATLQNGANYTIASTSTNGTLYKQTTTGGGSNRLAIQQTLTIGGTVTVDDKLTLTIYDAGLVGGKEAVVYKPNTGDTLADIVIRFRNKINNSAGLGALGITAKVSPTDSSVLLIESPTFDATEKFTSYSAKVKAGGTETMTLGSFWGTNGAQTISVTGPVTFGETVQFTVYNLDLPDEQKTVSYEVQPGDNLNKIRCGLRTEVNNDSDLAEIGVHATCAGGVLNLTSTSPTPGAYGLFPKIRCTPIAPSNVGVWPPADRVKICTGASLGSIVRNTVESLGNTAAFPGGGESPDAAQKLQASSIRWFLYPDHSAFYNSGDVIFLKPTDGPKGLFVAALELKWATIESDIRPFILGYSVVGTSLIFNSSADRFVTSPAPVSNDHVAHATAHETGHQLDAIYGSLTGTATFSESAAFKQALARDIELMNMVPPCRYQATDGRLVNGDDPPQRIGGEYASHDPPGTPSPVGGLPGLFTGVNAANGNPMCDDRVSNFGGSNFEKIKAAFPYFEAIKGKQPNDPQLQVAELFAEEYAVYVGFPDTYDNLGNEVNGSDSALINRNSSLPSAAAFRCTSLYVQTLVTEGRMPTAEELAGTGYSIPDIVSEGPDAGMFGFGERLHACDGSVGEVGNYSFGA